MTERPDPLAELPPRAPPRHAGPGPLIDGDLTACSNTPCATPPSVILWVGCLGGEHAGPLPLCAAHATTTAPSRRSCAQCSAEMRVMKITSMDGTSTVGYPDPPAPPPGLWDQAVPPA